MPGGAFQIAAATMAGQYLGARDLVRARRSVLMACGVATAIMIAAGVIFYVAAAPLAAFFLGGYNAKSCRSPRTCCASSPSPCCRWRS